MTVKRLKIACAGLGRMGKRHALNYLSRTPRAELVAVFTPDPREAAWARDNIGLFGVEVFADYDEMLRYPGLEAVAIATVTAVHAEQAIKAINAGLHVFSEKPLSTSVEISQSVVDAAKSKPYQKVLCGFSRRFDKSYRDAFTRLSTIGQPAVFRSQTCDKLDPLGFFVQYAEFSGGIFVDCSIHDIDLALWFFWRRLHHLRKHNDVDNGVGIVEFWNDKIAYFYCSRMMAAGQHDMTEIVGPKGNGVRRELPANYYERFEQAFVTMANEFTAACIDNKPLPFELDGAVKALAISVALRESMNMGNKILFNEKGVRIN
ncbi:hypothetical protein NM208_g9943 [Fusarium decemcellulare]|uniref:Uncharacterized protein n=1 Tax=Fusarium decemcellulare TaxID=57161 RepID=A0ACC1RZN3_9HYPO|nr:hypothetical protein NM208_g9943 [Fusarium decemcellulare]